jgi:hypothetical protein
LSLPVSARLIAGLRPFKAKKGERRRQPFRFAPRLISDLAEPAELLGCAGRRACTCICTGAGSRTCAPFLTPFVSSRAPVFTSLVPPRTPFLTPFHANGLGLRIGNGQCGSGCCDGEGSSFSEKRKSSSTGDRFRFDDFTHDQDSMVVGERPCGCQSSAPLLI